MSSTALMERTWEASPRLTARIAGALNLLATLAGAAAVGVGGRLGSVAYLIAASCNIAATLVFYHLFTPVSRRLSLLAASFGLVASTLGAFKWHPRGVDVGLIFFGSYCLLIGYLVLRSTFLPRILGTLMAAAGLGWLTLLSKPLAHHFHGYGMVLGIFGQASLTLWLLVIGVNVQRWKEQASAAEAAPGGRGRQG
jgi:hypothetical protein